MSEPTYTSLEGAWNDLMSYSTKNAGPVDPLFEEAFKHFFYSGATAALRLISLGQTPQLVIDVRQFARGGETVQ